MAQWLTRQVAQRVHRIERIDQVTQLLVVAHGGCQRAEADQHQRQQGQQRGPCLQQVVRYPARPAAMVDRPAPQRQAGQRAQQQEYRGKLQAQQVAHLAGVGLQRVDDHRCINDHVVGQHEVRDRGRRHQQKGQHRFERPAPGQQAQQQHQHKGNDQRKGDREHPAADLLEQAQLAHRQPQRQVGDRGQPGAHGKNQAAGMPESASPYIRQGHGFILRRPGRGPRAHAAWPMSAHTGPQAMRANRPSIAQATHQQMNAVHKVWLVKCAPRICCATPSTSPASSEAASQRRAITGAVPRQAK